MNVKTGSRVSRKAARFTESVIRGMSLEARSTTRSTWRRGCPTFPRPRRSSAPRAGHRRRHQPVRHHLGSARPAPGHRRAAAGWHLGLAVDPETEITVTCGSTEAMLVALLSMINPGDEVILFEPFYENYWPDCVLAGATPAFVAAPRRPAGRSIPTSWPPPSTTEHKAIILCNPNNPTGQRLHPRRAGGGRRPLPQVGRRWPSPTRSTSTSSTTAAQHVALAALDGMRERSVTISGMSKTYAVTGWRVGTMIAPPRLTHAFRQVHDFVSIVGAPPRSRPPAPSPTACRAATTPAWPTTTTPGATDSARRCVDVGFDSPSPQRGLLHHGRHLGLRRATTICVRPPPGPRRSAWPTVPGSSFYSNGMGSQQARFAFCKRAETLAAAEKRSAGCGPAEGQ